MTNPQGEGSASGALANRLQEMEELYMHLQRTVSDLDQVVVAQGKKLTELEKQLKGAAEMIRTMSSTQAGPPPSLLDEKPPHY
ncbi:MAG: SlyX family protein [Planctomycetaceae bacterium]|nr:SlyX family protein [Planctomycetaceae bacterium]